MKLRKAVRYAQPSKSVHCNVRCGSFSEVAARIREVCFTPKNRHPQLSRGIYSARAYWSRNSAATSQAVRSLQRTSGARFAQRLMLIRSGYALW